MGLEVVLGLKITDLSSLETRYVRHKYSNHLQRYLNCGWGLYLDSDLI